MSNKTTRKATTQPVSTFPMHRVSLITPTGVLLKRNYRLRGGGGGGICSKLLCNFEVKEEIGFQECFFSHFSLYLFQVSINSTDKCTFSVEPHTSDCVLSGISHDTSVKAEDKLLNHFCPFSSATWVDVKPECPHE